LRFSMAGIPIVSWELAAAVAAVDCLQHVSNIVLPCSFAAQAGTLPLRLILTGTGRIPAGEQKSLKQQQQQQQPRLIKCQACASVTAACGQAGSSKPGRRASACLISSAADDGHVDCWYVFK
jgi:hypothetical protein